MKIPPRFILNHEILSLVANIDSYRLFFSSIEVSLPLKEKIQRVSLLKSSLFSARIEGNPLRLDEIHSSSRREKKREIFNILRAIHYIDKHVKNTTKVNKGLILKLHDFVVGNVIRSNGFRQEMGAIFNQAGVAVYLSPPPLQIESLMSQLLTYINKKREKFPLISAIITHLIFEKIHPFLDGNGRIGRLLMYAVLKSHNYDFNFFVPFEEYLDQHKNDYYYYLDSGLKKPHTYLLFMLHGFLHQLEKLKQAVLAEINQKNALFVSPRQEEIYHIIKDHRTVSFDVIKRRFLAVPARTLRFDLKKLAEKGHIVKIGKTRGTYYSCKPREKI